LTTQDDAFLQKVPRYYSTSLLVRLESPKVRITCTLENGEWPAK
jgi:hypothetical protein